MYLGIIKRTKRLKSQEKLIISKSMTLKLDSKSYPQSHYIEVAQGGVLLEQYTIDCECLAYFLPKKNLMICKNSNFFL